MCKPNMFVRFLLNNSVWNVNRNVFSCESNPVKSADILVVLQSDAFDLHSCTEFGHYLYYFPFNLQRSSNNIIAIEEPSL